MKTSAVVMLSGGLDSAVALAQAKKQYDLKAITFDFGQRHADFEISSSRQIARAFGVPHEVIDISGLKRSFLGFSEEHTIAVGFFSLRSNCPHALFGLATTYTLVSGATALITGIHKGDFRESASARKYFDNYGKEVSSVQGVEFRLVSPFIDMEKSEIVKIGAKLKVPFQLTRSCTDVGILHCGQCPECQARKGAFASAGVKDTTKYMA